MPEDDARRQREIKAAMKQIKTFHGGRKASRWRLDVPVWRLALEGLTVFFLAFMSGLGLAVLYQVFTG